MKCKLPWSKASVGFEVVFKQTVRGDGGGDEGRDTESQRKKKKGVGRAGHTNVMMKNGARQSVREIRDATTS